MHVLAAFFDVGNDGFDVSDAIAIGVATGLIVGALRWVIRRWRSGKRWGASKIEDYVESVVVREIAALRTELRQLTAPIQPGANGGESLPDNTRLTAWCAEAIAVLAGHVGLSVADLPPRPNVRRTARTRSTDL